MGAGEILNSGILKLVVKRLNGEPHVFDPIDLCYVNWKNLSQMRKRIIISHHFAECLVNAANNIMFELDDSKLTSSDYEITTMLFTELVWFFRKAFLRSNENTLEKGPAGSVEFKRLLDSIMPNNPYKNTTAGRPTSVQHIEDAEREKEHNRRYEKSKLLYDDYEKFMETDDNGLPKLKAKWRRKESTNTNDKAGIRQKFYAPLDLHDLD